MAGDVIGAPRDPPGAMRLTPTPPSAILGA
jgi:hypothetical protein